jgi:hypothetical protein
MNDRTTNGIPRLGATEDDYIREHLRKLRSAVTKARLEEEVCKQKHKEAKAACEATEIELDQWIQAELSPAPLFDRRQDD